MDNKIGVEIGWLKKLADGLETLEEKQFKYQEWISAMVRVGTGTNDFCGTVCCAYGWMPKFVPESGVRWDAHGISSNPMGTFNAINNSIFSDGTIDGIKGHNLINFMFFGHDTVEGATQVYFMNVIDKNSKVQNSWENMFGLGDYDANLSQVVNRIRAVVIFIQRVPRL